MHVYTSGKMPSLKKYETLKITKAKKKFYCYWFKRVQILQKNPECKVISHAAA